MEHLLAIPKSLTMCFANDSLILVDSFELVMAFEILHKDPKSFAPQALQAKTKVQAFGRLPVCSLFMHMVRRLFNEAY